MNNCRICNQFRYPIVFLLFLLTACYPAPKIPIDTLRYQSPEGEHRVLFVFLPGNGDSMRAFEKNGLVQAVRARNLPVDMIAVNAHLGYYMKGVILERLKQDVIDPAKARGYRRIWLVGNSLGGYGSISYARQYPSDVAGVVLLGPFLGEKKIIREIIDAGGLQKWDPGVIPPNTRETWDKELWKWMKDGDQQKYFWDWIKTCDEENDGCPSRIYLGFGKADRFASGQKLMAQVLPPAQVFEIEGGHNWKTWEKAWNLILDRIVADARGFRVLTVGQ